jgi:hypothetical protein
MNQYFQNRPKIIILCIFLFSGVNRLNAQTPTDMEFVPKGNICAGISYLHSSWNKYWEADSLRENGNVGTVTTQHIGAGFNLGLLNRLNVIVMLPYVFTNASQGTLNGQNGLQDIHLDLKAKYGEWKLGPGKLRLVGDLGFSTPISGYLLDFAPLSIGTGTTNISYRQLVSYKLDKGFYLDLKGTYTYRSNVADIHRDFYFDQNNAYYTNEVEVPNLFDWDVTLGFSNKKILAEVNYLSYSCFGGGDMRVWDPGFPSNKMDATEISARFDYYFSKPRGLYPSVIAGYTLTGRNVGKSTFAGISLNYTFPVWGKRKAADKPTQE